MGPHPIWVMFPNFAHFFFGIIPNASSQHFKDLSPHHHRNLSQVCLHRQHEPNLNDTEDDHHISENRTDFDGELLGSQATPEIDFLRFGILTTRAFQRVVNYSCGWSMSREICNQSWYG